MSLLREDLRCRNCGHSAGYHSTPVCGYNHGAGRKTCECAQWDGVSYSLTVAEARIAELVAERDAYMQAVLDAIHALAQRPREEPNVAPDEPDGLLCLAARMDGPSDSHLLCSSPKGHDGDHANRLYTWPR